MIRSKIALKVLPYIAGFLFASMWGVAMEVSSELSAMQDLGMNLYHEPTTIQIYWLQSKACVIVPPVSFVANCTFVSEIGEMTILMILLLIVLIGYMILRRKSLEQSHNPVSGT